MNMHVQIQQRRKTGRQIHMHNVIFASWLAIRSRGSAFLPEGMAQNQNGLVRHSMCSKVVLRVYPSSFPTPLSCVSNKRGINCHLWFSPVTLLIPGLVLTPSAFHLSSSTLAFHLASPPSRSEIPHFLSRSVRCKQRLLARLNI